ncbi:MAG TPA: hypothetical protein VEI97_18265 [bacterium]|nr:hypothetical protein [bacterium]
MFFCPQCGTPRAAESAPCPACDGVPRVTTANAPARSSNRRQAGSSWPVLAGVALVMGLGLAAGVVQRQGGNDPAPRRVLRVPPGAALSQHLARANAPQPSPPQPSATLEQEPDPLQDFPEERQRALYATLVDLRWTSADRALRERGGQVGDLDRGDRFTLQLPLMLTTEPHASTAHGVVLAKRGTEVTVLERRQVGLEVFLHLRLSPEEAGWTPLAAMLDQGLTGAQYLDVLKALEERQTVLEAAGRRALAKKEGVTERLLERIFERGSSRGWEYE